MQIHLPPKVMGLSVGLAVLLNYTIPIIHVVKPPYNSIGWFVLSIGIVFMIAARRTLQAYRTTLNPIEKPSGLVTTGPFRVSRNPFYVGYFLIILGVALVLGGLTSFIGPLLFLVWMNAKVIPTEERNLEQIFGQRYTEYKQNTRRWL